MDAQYGNVLYYQEVRYLSCGKVLRFFELHGEIRAFQGKKKNSIPFPLDNHWLADLAFLVDITELMNILNLQLQERDQIITQQYDHVRAFKQNLQLLSRQQVRSNFDILLNTKQCISLVIDHHHVIIFV